MTHMLSLLPKSRFEESSVEIPGGLAFLADYRPDAIAEAATAVTSRRAGALRRAANRRRRHKPKIPETRRFRGFLSADRFSVPPRDSFFCPTRDARGLRPSGLRRG
ncbi:MAG: hypothetical protein EGP78_02365 [Alistipes shahii]|nr:hypothetical protein [Alistipes shahii]